MAINERLKQLLAIEEIPYEVFQHREAFTAQEVAQASGIPGKHVAKVVVLKDRVGSHFIVVIPASQQLDVVRAGHVTGRRGIEFAHEDEIARLFPDCVVGAMPPFGNLYGVSMFVDPCLLTSDTIYFQAGNHREVVRMAMNDYRRLERPVRLGECLHEAPRPARI